MSWLDYTVTAISAGCTIVSGVGAYKSRVYYKKSKQLNLYTSANGAYIESKKILTVLTEILKLRNQQIRSKNNQRGKNYANKVSEKGESIKNSISKIRESLPSKDYKEVQNILNTQKLNVELYIDSFISGEAFVDGEIIIGDRFYVCQEAFGDIQLFLKDKINIVGEKLK